MAAEDLDHRFDHHAPTSDEIAQGHDFLRKECRVLAHSIDRILVDGREKSLALTKLEETMFWANASIARNQHVALTADDQPATDDGGEEGAAMT